MFPFFYNPEISPVLNSIELDETTSSHVVQVLRMKAGEKLNLTNGRGNLFECEINDAHRKRCTVNVLQKTFLEPPAKKISIGISLLKNTSRFEWFLEKATELGISEIVPMICERTEKEKFRYERMKQICISAMLQSQQCWLPELRQPVLIEDHLTESETENKLIAHCIHSIERRPIKQFNNINSATILIGPEGDFTEEEVKSAVNKNFISVSLGNNRLRTETAALKAAVLLTA